MGVAVACMHRSGVEGGGLPFKAVPVGAVVLKIYNLCLRYPMSLWPGTHQAQE